MAWDNEWVFEDDHDYQEAADREENLNDFMTDPADLVDDDCDDDAAYADEQWDGFQSDAEADADVLRMAGMGTDEDYNYYGGDEY